MRPNGTPGVLPKATAPASGRRGSLSTALKGLQLPKEWVTIRVTVRVTIRVTIRVTNYMSCLSFGVLYSISQGLL